MKDLFLGTLIVMQAYISFAALVRATQAESSLQNEKRSVEALRRTFGKAPESAYVCYGSSARRQLASLLED